MISYEVSISLTILPVILFSGSLNLNIIMHKQQETIWFIFPLLPISIIFFISILAETNRAPFDLPEAEAELVAGYNVEYSSVLFAAFFLGEYANILLMSCLFVIFFLSGGNLFIIKLFFYHWDILFKTLL
jgi:NADH-quinone oxidoreductase subunit H